MREHLRSLNERQLRELIAALARSATPWSMDSTLIGIDAIGAELLRRETESQTNHR